MREELEKLIKERKDKVLPVLTEKNAGIPVVCAVGTSLAEAWENSLLGLVFYGCDIHTAYDKTDDPPSKDCTMQMLITSPGSEPLIHRGFPGGLEDLEEYRQEVLEGIKDHWVRDPENPEDKRWEYTYHERLFSYKVPGINLPIDQIKEVIDCLSRTPYSRRCQAITWKPWQDTKIDDPACLQSMWFRISQDEKGGKYLNMNTRFRSRDAYDAAFMNCFAFIHLQEMVAREVGRIRGEEIKPGRFVDISDSYHIYGRRLEDFYSRFLSQLTTRSFEDRTWTRGFASGFFEDAKPVIAKKLAAQNEKYK